MDIDTIRYFGAAYVMESNLSPKEKCNMIDYIKEAEWDQVLNLVFNGNPPTRKLTINEQYILEAQAENYIYPLILKYMVEDKKSDEKKTKKSGKKDDVVKTDTTAHRKKLETAGKKGRKDIVKQVRLDAGEVYSSAKDKGAKIYGGAKRQLPAAKRFLGAASVVVLIAAATAAAHRVYKVYLSKSARACKGLDMTQRRNCIVKYRKAGHQAKMNTYIKARTDCRKSKSPERCQRELDTKIKKVKYKIGTLYSRL